MSGNYLVSEKKGNICTIALNRPEKRNAINVEMLTGFCEMVEHQGSDPDVRAIILKGEGKIFRPVSILTHSALKSAHVWGKPEPAAPVCGH